MKHTSIKSPRFFQFTKNEICSIDMSNPTDTQIGTRATRHRLPERAKIFIVRPPMSTLKPPLAIGKEKDPVCFPCLLFVGEVASENLASFPAALLGLILH